MRYYKESYKSKVVKNHEKTVQVIFITFNSIFNTNGHRLWDSRIKKEQQNFYDETLTLLSINILMPEKEQKEKKQKKERSYQHSFEKKQ